MAVSGQAIRAGRAFFELFAEDSKLQRVLDEAAGRVRKFASTIGTIGLKAGAAGGAIMAPLGKGFLDAATRGRDVQALADRFGLTTESVSALGYAFETARVPFEEFSAVMDGLAGRVKAAADGNSQLVDGLKGLNGRALIDLGLDEQLELIADRFKDIKNPIDQARVAEDLFGSAGLRLLPTLKKGAEGIRELRAEAAGAGAVISAKDAAASAAVLATANTFWRELGNTVRAVGTALVPAANGSKDFNATIREGFASARQWVTQHSGLIVLVAKIAGGLVLAGAALGGLRIALSLLGPVFTLVKVGIGGVGVAFGLLLSPIGMIVGALGGLFALWATTTEAGRKSAASLGAAFRDVGTTFAETWAGVMGAIKKGDLKGAFDILGVGIKLSWFKTLRALGRALAEFVEENRATIVTLASLWGGFKAAKIGARFGGVGGVIGAGVGAAAAGFGADELVDRIAGLKNTPKLDATIAALDAELKALVGKAKEPGKGGEVDAAALDRERMRLELLKKQAAAIPPLGNSQKGVFSGPISQQLGYADQTQRRQLDQLQGINKGVQQLAPAVGKAVADAVKPLFPRFG